MIFREMAGNESGAHTRYRAVSLLLATVSTLLLATTSFAQKEDPRSLGSGIKADQMSVRCAVSDEYPLYVEEVQVQVFNAARNLVLRNKKPFRGAQFTYYYEPVLRLRRRAGRPEISQLGETTLMLTIEQTDVRRAVYEHIRYNANPDVMLANVKPICQFGYWADHPLATADFVRTQEAGRPLPNEISIRLEFPPDQIANAKDRIEAGEPIEFGYTLLTKHTAGTFIDITAEKVMNTNAYRDYFSPVSGNLVWSLHAYAASTQIIEELTASIVIEDTSLFTRYAQHILDSFLVGSRRVEVSFEELAEGRGQAPDVIDMNGVRFATDVINGEITDVRNKDSSTWCHKFTRDLERNLERNKTGEWGGGGGFSIWKLSINGEAHKKGTDELVEGFKDVVNSEDCGGRLITNSFHYEWDGIKHVPKGIIAVDVVSGSDVAKRSRDFKLVVSSQDYRNVTVDVF